MSLNRVIGAGGKIPWHLPEDFKWFQKTTMGNVIVMGRKTFESLGQPLPNRKNLILTRIRSGSSKVIRNFRAISRVARGRYLKRAYQFHFSKLEKDQKTDLLIFNSLERLDPSEFPNEISSAARGHLRADVAALFRSFTSRWSNARWKATRFSRRLKTGSCWLKKSATRRSSKSCITGTAH